MLYYITVERRNTRAQEKKMKCKNCNQEFTASDKQSANFVGSSGDYSHKMCPGTKCQICKQEIAEHAQAKRTALMHWQHRTCKPVRITRPDNTVTEPKASSWIAR